MNDLPALRHTAHDGVDHVAVAAVGRRKTRGAAQHVRTRVEQPTPVGQGRMEIRAVGRFEQLDGVANALVELFDRLGVDRRVVEELAEDLAAEVPVEGGVQHAGVEHIVDRHLQHGENSTRGDRRDTAEPLDERGDLLACILRGKAHVAGHGANDGGEVDTFHRFTQLGRRPYCHRRHFTAPVYRKRDKVDCIIVPHLSCKSFGRLSAIS